MQLVKRQVQQRTFIFVGFEHAPCVVPGKSAVAEFGEARYDPLLRDIDTAMRKRERERAKRTMPLRHVFCLNCHLMTPFSFQSFLLSQRTMENARKKAHTKTASRVREAVL